MITDETKKIIIDDLDVFLDKIADSVHLGLCEDMSPNDPEFSYQYELRLSAAQDYILLVLEGEI